MQSDPMSPELLAAYLKIMREQGVIRLKTATVDILLGPAPGNMLSSTRPNLTYEDLAFAATEGIAEEGEADRQEEEDPH